MPECNYTQLLALPGMPKKTEKHLVHTVCKIWGLGIILWILLMSDFRLKSILVRIIIVLKTGS